MRVQRPALPWLCDALLWPGHHSAIISADVGSVPSRLRMLSPGFGRGTRSRHPFPPLGRSHSEEPLRGDADSAACPLGYPTVPESEGHVWGHGAVANRHRNGDWLLLCCRRVPVACLKLTPSHRPLGRRSWIPPPASCCLPDSKHLGSCANAEPACFDKPSRMKHGFCSPDSPKISARPGTVRDAVGWPGVASSLALGVTDQLPQPAFMIGPVKAFVR
jgi:hypothetical protein